MTDREAGGGSDRPDHDRRASLFRTTPDPAIGYELAAGGPVVRAVNPAFAATFDASPDDPVGRPLSAALVGDADGSPAAADLAERIGDGEAVDVVVRRAAGDDERAFRCRSIRLDGDARADDAVDGYVVYTDVTGRERERRALADRVDRAESFSRVVSHDLRNPIDVAEIRIEAARDTGETVHFEKALWAVRRMNDIVESVRAMTLDDERVTPETVDLDATVEAAWDTVDTAGATLRAADLGAIRADRDLLQQLLENLFRNSVEHGSTSNRTESDDSVEHGSTGNRPEAGDSRDGDAGTTVSVGPLDDGTGGFYVADDGPGIPAAERDRVFEPRYSTADDGTGYGLAIVERIATAHGWGVSLTASDEGGARFEFAGVEAESEP